MIASVDPTAPVFAAVLDDQYLAAYGKCGGLGCFTAPPDISFNRGDRVLLQTPRGLEVGVIRSQATIRQARLVGAQASGQIVRLIHDADRDTVNERRSQAETLFGTSQRLASTRGLGLQVLDAEVLFDGRCGIVQFAARTELPLDDLAEELERICGVGVRFENLATGGPEPEVHGCGKPDCGKGEGGCSSCGSGGCSSCGSGPVDLKPYFAHLRTRMESERTSLL